LDGIGIALYTAATLADTLRSPAQPAAPVDWQRSAGTGMLGLAVVLGAHATGLTLGEPTALWVVLLAGAGVSLFWSGAGSWSGLPDEDRAGVDDTFLRTALGVGLAVAAALLVLNRTLRLHHVGPAAAGTAASLAILALVGGPWWLRSRRILAAERIARARAQERAEVADHLHDSVLQTLALIQRRSGDAGAVASLARRQERELRDWLLGRRPSLDSGSLTDALRAVAAHVEDAYGAEFELVIVGDADVDDRVGALLAATREALVNTAKHAPGAPVSVYCRADEEAITVYVHDRGPGFDPDDIPPERHGVRESIIGRVRRQGGIADVRSEPGAGCEVILSLDRR